MQSQPKFKKLKFRPDDADNPIRKLDWAQHRGRVVAAKPKVDTSNPIVRRSVYSSTSNFNTSVSHFVRIEQENARMLHRIACIMECEPKVDSHLARKLPTGGGGNKTRVRQLNLLQITFDNLKMFQRIESAKSAYSRKEQLDDYAKYEKQMELSSFYPLHWKLPPTCVWDKYADDALSNAARNPRPQVFLELETDQEQLGQVVIELRADVVPFSAENFRALCTGERGLSYKCSEIHRIVPGILWQGGDVSGLEGKSIGKSIYGDSFPDENFKLKHNTQGIVSMVTAGKNTNASQFLITAIRLESLNGVNVVIGKVISGMDVLDKVSALVTSSGRPKHRVWISKCGETGGDSEEGGEGEQTADGRETDEAAEDEE